MCDSSAVPLECGAVGVKIFWIGARNQWIFAARAIDRTRREIHQPQFLIFRRLLAHETSLTRVAREPGLDVTVRLVGGNEDFIGIVLPKRSQVHQQAMLIRHSESDVADLRHCC